MSVILVIAQFVTLKGVHIDGTACQHGFSYRHKDGTRRLSNKNIYAILAFNGPFGLPLFVDMFLM